MSPAGGARVAGAGLSLRDAHLGELLKTPGTQVGWLEVVTENLFSAPPRFIDGLSELAERYPLVLHGVGLNLGSSDPLDEQYLDRAAAWAERLGARWLSDHLCWSGVAGQNSHDLIPLPARREVVDHCVRRIEQVQKHWGRTLVIENVSAYLRPRGGELSEWEFLSQVVEGSGCEILLDLNNLWVNAKNFGFDPLVYLEAIPLDRVRQAHLAGHEVWDGIRVDTHSRPICTEVWDLYRNFVARAGPVPTAIEWDREIPALEVLLREARAIDVILRGASDAVG